MGNGRSPFVASDSNKDKPAEAPPVNGGLNTVDVMKPAERPADRPAQPEARSEKPVGTVGPGAPKELTQDQIQAEALAGQAVQAYVEATQGGTRQLTQQQFDELKTKGFDKALADAKSVDPRSIQVYEGLAQAELAKVIPTPEKQKETLTKVITAQGAMEAALNALTPDQQKTFIGLEDKFAKDLAVLQQEANALQSRPTLDPAGRQADMIKIEARATALQKQLNEDKAKISPALESAMKEVQALDTPEGRAAAAFLAQMNELDNLRHAPAMVSLLYAQVLEKQGGAENLKKAKELTTEAAKDSKVAAILNGPNGVEFATRMGVKTELVQKMEDDVKKVFPEFEPVQKAMAALADTTKDPKARLEEFSKHFEEALLRTDREGPDARKVEELRKEMTELQTKLEAVQKEIQVGARTEFTQKEKDDFTTLQQLDEKIKNVSLLRLNYAMALNKHGYEHNDEAAKKRAIEVLKEIKTVDPLIFDASPEIQGSLKQAQEGKKIELTSATAEDMTSRSLAVLSQPTNNIADLFLPGVGPGLTAATRPFGVTPGDIPVAGRLFETDAKKANEKAVVSELARAYLTNEQATQARINQSVQEGRSGVREFGTDGLAIGVGWLTKVGADKALTKAPGYLKPLGFVAGLATAGLTKDAAADGELGTGTDWLRGAGMFGGSRFVMRGLNANPSRQVLSEATAQGVGKRLGVEGLSGTGSQLSAQILKAEAGGSWLGRTGAYFNPMNYTGLSFQQGGLRYVGFGGERTAQYLANGGLSFAQYNARRAVGNVGTLFGMGYAAGSGREALYIGTGQRQFDGTPHNFETALSSINGSGLQGGFTASLVMPVAGSTFRMVGGGRVLDGTSRLATRYMPVTAPQLGQFGLVAAGPGLQQLDKFNSANRLEDLSVQARAVADEARRKAEEELRKQQQGRP